MRRPVTLYLLLLCLLCVASCHRRPTYPSSLLRADSLADANATEALSLLHQLEADTATWSGAARMYHQLLTVKAQDKAYIPHTSDSVMLPILHYYEHGGDKDLLPTAYYYMGSTCRDLNDGPRALEYYQKALDVMPVGASVLRRVTNNQMGFLFYRQYLFDQALSCYLASLRNDSVMNDKAEIASDLVNIGYIYRCREELSTALDYYKSAKEVLAGVDDIKAMDEIDAQIASLYLELQMYEEAKQAIQSPLQHASRSTISNVYSIAAKVYYYIGEIDSAKILYRQLLNVGNIYGKQAAYQHLADIAFDNGEIREGLDYICHFSMITDSIQQITSTESIAQMNALYNYQKAIEEREAVMVRMNKNRWTILMLSLSLIIILLGVWLFHRRTKKRRQAMLDKLEELEQTREMMRIADERAIENLRRQIEELEKQLESNAIERKDLYWVISAQKNTIQSHLLEAEERMRQNETLDEQLKNSEIYAHIINLINKRKRHLSQRDFDNLKKTYEEVAPVFMEKLLGLCTFNDIELEVTLLRRMGISPTDIAFLTSYVKSKISNVRSALYNRVTGKKGEAAKWDELIRNL